MCVHLQIEIIFFCTVESGVISTCFPFVLFVPDITGYHALSSWAGQGWGLLPIPLPSPRVQAQGCGSGELGGPVRECALWPPPGC